MTTEPDDAWDEYWPTRHDPDRWLPLARLALEVAGLPTHGMLRMLTPSQLPTVHARTANAIVTIYPDIVGRSSYELEVEAHELIGSRELPVPELLAHGHVVEGRPESNWSWLIETVAEGEPWTRVRNDLAPEQRRRTAYEVGANLRRLHETPHEHGRLLRPDWEVFRELVADELANLGRHDNRLDAFPTERRTELRQLAEKTFGEIDTSSATCLLHGDVHGDNVLLDPATGEVTGLIDLNEMGVGDRWYDLADASYRMLHGDQDLIAALLDGYGLDDSEIVRAPDRLLGWGLLHDFSVFENADVGQSS